MRSLPSQFWILSTTTPSTRGAGRGLATPPTTWKQTEASSATPGLPEVMQCCSATTRANSLDAAATGANPGADTGTVARPGGAAVTEVAEGATTPTRPADQIPAVFFSPKPNLMCVSKL